MTDYAAVLQTNYPGTEWALSNNDYDTLQWFSDTPKPTQAELDAAWPDAQAKIAAEADAKVAARAAALAKLKVLGLTDDEISALIGG